MFFKSIMHSSVLKLQTLILTEIGMFIKKIVKIIYINIKSVNHLQKKTRENDYNSEQFLKMNVKFVKNKSRFDRSIVITFEVKTEMIKNVIKNKRHREIIVVEIVENFKCFTIIILKILKKKQIQIL